MKNTLIPLPLFLSCSAFALHLNAAPLEEVVVTGEFHDASAFEISNSVSVIDEAAIIAREAQQLEDLLNIAPNVNFSTGASRGRFIQIRGIGERSQFVAPVNSSVGVIVDGIDMTGISTGVTTLDTQQMEVFRGPQGTLYGANALAGMINVVGNDATDTFYGKIKAGLGNYGRYDVNVQVSNTLNEKVGWRFATQKSVSDGYIDNEYLDRSDTNNIDEKSLRNLFSFQINDDIDLKLISYYVDVDNGYDAFSLDNNRTTLSDQPGHDRQRTFANALHLNVASFSFADLQSVVSIANSEIEYGYDEDWSYREICPEVPASEDDINCAYWQYSKVDNYERDNDNRTFDIRLASKSDSTIQWAIGAYFRNQNVDLIRTYTNNDPDEAYYSPITDPAATLYISEYETKNAAIYGQITLPLNDKLELVGGARFEDYSADFADSNNSIFAPKESIWGGKLALEYQANDKHLIYALISRGYKFGGFNPDPDLEDAVKNFDTETMINYEVGSKARWLDDTLNTQVAFFYQDRNNIQAKQSRAYIVDGTPEFVDFIDNAAEGVNYGIETELNWYANDSIKIFASLGLLKTEFRDFVNVSHVDRDEETGEGYDMSGRAQAHAPEYQYFAGVQWSIISELNARIEVEGKDSFYFSFNHEEKSEAYNLINLRLSYDLGRASFALWVKNLTDETVETRGFYFGHEFGNDPRKLYAPEPYTQKGAPRTFGASASYTF